MTEQRGPEGEPEGSKAEPEGPQAEPEGPQAEPEGSQAEPEGSQAEPEGDECTRRSFLGLCTLGIGACASAGVLGTVGTAVLGAPEGESSEHWVDVGSLSRFSEGVATKVPAIGKRRDAWNRYEPRGLGSVIVVREGEGARAFSSTCPHNGCSVFVSDASLLCPCHDSRFALDGSLTDGESPRGLDPLEVRISEGRVSVLYRRFVVGIPERKPI